MTQENLAEKLGVSNRTVSRWENGKNLPDPALFNLLCETLEISLTEFLSGEHIQQDNIVQKAEENIMTSVVHSNKKTKRLTKTLIVISLILLIVTYIPMMNIRSLYYQDNYIINDKNGSTIVLFQGEYYYPITDLPKDEQQKYLNYAPVTYEEFENYTKEYTGVNTDRILAFVPEGITAVYKEKTKIGQPYFIMLNHDTDYCFYCNNINK